MSLRSLVQTVAKEERLETYPSVSIKQITLVENSDIGGLPAVQNWIRQEKERINTLGLYESVSWIQLILNLEESELQTLAVQVPDLKSFIDSINIVTQESFENRIISLEQYIERIKIKLQAKAVIAADQKTDMQDS